MSESTITVTIRTRWWFCPLLRTCLLATRLTGWRPSEAAIERIVRHGVKFDV